MHGLHLIVIGIGGFMIKHIHALDAGGDPAVHNGIGAVGIADRAARRECQMAVGDDCAVILEKVRTAFNGM